MTDQMIIDIALIKRLLESDITSYQIAKATGVATQSLDNYRKLGSKVENMRLGVAQKLYDYAKKVFENS